MPGTRVLVADDDGRLTELISRYLALEGFEVETVADGLHAVERATTVPAPDIVVLDIVMTGIDGLEACRRIRSNFATAQVPILIFSALDEQQEAARRAGAQLMLRKPFTLPLLVQTIRQLLG
jgi:CheY-like chemotaxis protein